MSEQQPRDEERIDAPDEPADESEQDNRDRVLGRLAGRILKAGAEAVAETSERLQKRGEDLPHQVLNTAVNLTSRGKDEMMTIVAREVRSYMEKLQVWPEVKSFMTSHALEVNASIRLKPVADAIDRAEEPEPEEPEDQSGGER